MKISENTLQRLIRFGTEIAGEDKKEFVLILEKIQKENIKDDSDMIRDFGKNILPYENHKDIKDNLSRIIETEKRVDLMVSKLVGICENSLEDRIKHLEEFKIKYDEGVQLINRWVSQNGGSNGRSRFS